MTVAGAAERIGFADPIAAAWRERRSELTHDRLRNRLLPRLHGCLALLRDGEASPEMTRRLFAPVDDWPACAEEGLQLANELCDVMSPLRVVDAVTWAMPSEAAGFLRTTALEAWRWRHQIPRLLDQIHSATSAANAAYASWSHDRSACALQSLAEEAEQLARALSALPNRVSW